MLSLVIAGPGLLLQQACSDRPSEQGGDVTSTGQEGVRHSLEAAEVYIAGGEVDKARTILSRLIEEDPVDARPYEVMARLLLAQGIQLRQVGLMDASKAEFKASFDLYTKAIERMPESSGLHQSAGEVAQQAGLRQEALDMYLRSVELDPINLRSQINAAQLLIEEAPDQSERMLRTVLEADPNQPHALSSLALLLLRVGKTEESESIASRALAVAGDQEGVRIAIARVHREAGRPRMALELLLALPDHIRSQEPATVEIARSWESIGRPMNAGQAWADCFAANAHRTDAWRFALSAAESLGLAGQTAMASSWLEQAIMLDAPVARVEGARRLIAESGRP